jgi:thiol-disulfide isomerase/thioredoxin
MKKRFTGVVAILLLILNVSAQPLTARPLCIGDTMPDITLTNIINHPVSSIQLSALKDKAIILDFFATSCGACIGALPRLDSLQRSLKGQVQIIVVCYESKATIQQFLHTNTRLKNISLPFITGDTLLKKLFPYYLLPQEVWLQQNKVLAVTRAEDVTAENLQQLLNDTMPSLTRKKDRMDFNRQLSLQTQLAVTDSSLLKQQSFITGYQEELGSFKGVTNNTYSRREYFVNWNIFSLLQYAWGIPANRMLLEVNQPANWLDKNTRPQQWRNRALFCCEITVPAACSSHQIKQSLQQLFNASLPLQAKLEKRQQPCYILKVAPHAPELYAATMQSRQFTNNNRDSIFFLHYTLEAFVNACNASSGPVPGKPVLINETGLKQPVDLQIPLAALQDMHLLRQSLLRYNLLLEPDTRLMDMLVITDNPSILPTNTNNCHD